MPRQKRSTKLASLDARELVTCAIEDHLTCKDVVAELSKRPPSRAAAELVVKAYRRGSAPPWLAALLLGECRDTKGYATAREILLAAPRRQSAEDYAGVAMAKIGGREAFQDLCDLTLNASGRRSREGAAYGLEKLGLPEAAPILLEAGLAGKIRSTQAAWIASFRTKEYNAGMQ